MLVKFAVRGCLAILILTMIIMMQPGCSKRMAILYFTDSDNDFMGEALERMNFAFTRIYSLIDFATIDPSAEWDLIIFDNRFPSLAPGYQELLLTMLFYYQQQGGKVILTTNELDNADFAILLGAFGYEHKATSLTPISVYKIDPDSEFWTEPNDVPDLYFAGVTDTYGTAPNAFKGAAILSGIKMASFNAANRADLNAGAIFKANSGRTILNAFFLDDAVVGGVPIDFDVDGIADAVEWYMNELAAIEKVPGEKVKLDIPN